VVFAIWFILRCLQIWGRGPFGMRDIDQSLARAATIIVALLIAHSVVDYPLRTAAMMAIMAFACGLIIKPLRGAESTERTKQQSLSEDAAGRAPSREAFAMHALPAQWGGASPPLKPSPRPKDTVAEEAAPAEPQPKGERWGKDVEWPEKWRKREKPPDPDGNDT